jgi:hypothetical protein
MPLRRNGVTIVPSYETVQRGKPDSDSEIFLTAMPSPEFGQVGVAGIDHRADERCGSGA